MNSWVLAVRQTSQQIKRQFPFTGFLEANRSITTKLKLSWRISCYTISLSFFCLLKIFHESGEYDTIVYLFVCGWAYNLKPKNRKTKLLQCGVSQSTRYMTISKRSRCVVMRTALPCGRAYVWELFSIVNFDPNLSREHLLSNDTSRIIYAYVMNYTLWSCWSPNDVRVTTIFPPFLKFSF